MSSEAQPYASYEDVRRLENFTDADPSDTREFLALVYAEINSRLRARGFSVPVTAPADLVGMLKSANVYGAAAMLSVKSAVGKSSDQRAGESDVYQKRFEDIIARIEGWSDDQLARMGVSLVMPVVVMPMVGLTMVGNAKREGERGTHWSSQYPFRRVE